MNKLKLGLHYRLLPAKLCQLALKKINKSHTMPDMHAGKPHDVVTAVHMEKSFRQVRLYCSRKWGSFASRNLLLSANTASAGRGFANIAT